MYNKPVHTQDLGEQAVLDVTRIFLPCRWFLGLCLKEVLFIEMDASVLNSGPVEAISESGSLVLQVSLSFHSIKTFLYVPVTLLRKQQ